jgi:DNA-binding winged helix-turn-helix (wHTH) protein/TolB-like protein
MSVSIPSPVNPLYEFGPFRLDAAECRLQRMGEPIPLPPKVFDLLVILVSNQGKIVDKDELMSQLWPDSFVEENNLAVNISLLRKSLADGSDGQKYIETIPKRGYRFIAPVTRPQSLSPNLIVEREVTTSVVIEDQSEATEPRLVGAHSTSVLTVPTLPSTPERAKSKLVLPSIIVAATLIVGATVWFFAFRSGSPATLPNVTSIAVLPFKPLTYGTEDNALGLGMADALITKLSNLDNITIRPTSAILKYDGQNQDSIAAGKALGVQAVIDGRIQRDADKIRVTVQLLRVDDGKPIWADSFEERFTNIFKVQDAISERTARSFVSKLTAEQHQRLVRHYTENTEAYQAYIKGRYFWNKRSDDGLKKAIDYFKQAIDLDPSYALAYSGLSDCYSVMATSIVLLHRQDGDNPSALAKAAAEKAIEIDDSIAEAHTSLAACLAGFDDQAAHREFERAITLNPNYATAYNF